MRGFLLLITLAAALAACGIGFAASQVSPAAEARRQVQADYEAQRNRLDLAERQRQAQAVGELVDAILPAAKVAGVLGVLMLPPAAVALAALGVWAMRRRAELVNVAPGVPPLPRAGLLRGDHADLTALGLAGHWTTQAETARNPAPPSLPDTLRSFTYAPRAGRESAPRVIGEASKPPPVLGRGVPVPAFGDLMAHGQIGHDRRLLLGFEPDGASLRPVLGDLGAIYSVALAGQSGSGKTTTARCLVAQAVLLGARALLIDPHAHAGEESLAAALAPLAPALLAPPASTDDDIRGVVRLVDELIDRREAGETGPPVLVCVDGWTELQDGRRAADLTRVMRRVCVAGRKLQVYALISGQDWTKASAGAIRDVLTGAYVHKLRPPVARLISPGTPADVWNLPAGHAYLDRPGAPRSLVIVPQTTGADLEAVALRLPPPAPVAPPSPWTVIRGGGGGGGGGGAGDGDSDGESDTENATTTDTTTTDPDQARRERIRELSAQGVSRSTICSIVWGYKDSRTMGLVADVLGPVAQVDG